jgi:hypothetical protein
MRLSNLWAEQEISTTCVNRVQGRENKKMSWKLTFATIDCAIIAQKHDLEEKPST